MKSTLRAISPDYDSEVSAVGATTNTNLEKLAFHSRSSDTHPENGKMDFSAVWSTALGGIYASVELDHFHIITLDH